jgi:hypothetical protein
LVIAVYSRLSQRGLLIAAAPHERPGSSEQTSLVAATSQSVRFARSLACVATALVLFKKKEKKLSLDQRMIKKKITTHTIKNIMTYLRLNEPNGDNIFCGWIVNHLLSYSRLLPLQSTKDLLTCEKLSLYQILSITLCYLEGGNTFEALKFVSARFP